MFKDIFTPHVGAFDTPEEQQRCVASFIHMLEWRYRTDQSENDLFLAEDKIWKEQGFQSIWDCPTHKLYLERAKYLLSKAEFENLMNILFNVQYLQGGK